MKKYVFLVAGLSAVSLFAHDRDALSIGNRLGDGAYMKATGLSPVEWAAQCGHHQNAEMTKPSRIYGYSETERLMPEQTPASTETSQGSSQTYASSTETGVSAGPSSNANYSATLDDTVPTESFTDNQQLAVGASPSVSTGSDISKSYSKDHSPIYTDSSDLSAAGAPASAERGSSSSSSSSSSFQSEAVDGALSPAVTDDQGWETRIKSDLTKESPDNTSADTFTTENLRDVQIHRANGVVILTGTVPSEHMKRELETRVKQISGLDRIDNQLGVAPSADKPADGTSIPRD